MDGAASHLDTFDHKPLVNEYAGKPLPQSIERVITPMGVSNNPLLASQRKWQKYGDSGIEISDWYPNVATCADDLCVIRSCWADALNHVGGVCQMNTGSILAGRPSMGSWVTYGLGTENQDLPGYITIKPTLSHGGAKNFGSAFLPGAFQGTPIGHSGMKVDEIKAEPIQYLVNKGLTPEQQRFELDMIQNINRKHQEMRTVDANLEARIQAFELAFRMQTQAPEIFAVDKESEETKKLYGLDDPKTADFGWQCLLARRLCEKGVRFVQCTHSYKWDQHGDLRGGLKANCKNTDQACAALVSDLKARGLLEDTIVIWGGEFGRTPMVQGEGRDGRDHHPNSFAMWFAGGGFKPGVTWGESDDLGFNATENKVHVRDMHATVLHQLGLDHTKLTYRFQGRDFRLTDVHGKVAEKIFA